MGCTREARHLHHIEYRSHGGRTIAANEISVCRTCHALLHADLLEVTADPHSGLRWRARSEALDVNSGVAAAVLTEIPVVRVESAIAASIADSGLSAIADSPAVGHLEDLVGALAGALVRLGLSRKEARARLERAHEELRRRGEDAGDEAKLLTLALSAT